MVLPHPAYTYGPYVFIAMAFLLSALFAPAGVRLVERWHGRGRRGALDDEDGDELPRPKSPPWSKLAGVTVSLVSVWLASTLLGALCLALPVCEEPGRLPGEHVDAAVIAHLVPTTSKSATEQLLRRLEADAGERWSPRGALEARLVMAARIDTDPGRAVERLARNRLRTHAGLFALSRPTPEACAVGLASLAEAMRGGALSDLMLACRNTPGDHVGHAAFKMGDFMRAVGPEAESIVSRLPRPPAGEPECLAGGFDVPDGSMPLCRLVHAEMIKKTRTEVLATTEIAPVFARRWAAALRAEMGEPLAEAWTIDPATLVVRPLRAIADEPIAVFADIRAGSTANLTPAQGAWIRLALAAERSAMGRHADAAVLVDEAERELDLGAGASPEERAQAARLIAAIALRAGDDDRAGGALADLDESDPLHALGRWLRGEGPRPDAASFAVWDEADVGGDGAALAAALERADAARGGLLRLRLAPEAARPVLREWAREAFPACDRCELFAELDRLTVRLDAAYALEDEALVMDLAPVVARFEAVFLNRLLALSLRAASLHFDL